jgi:hypothetical protein
MNPQSKEKIVNKTHQKIDEGSWGHSLVVLRKLTLSIHKVLGSIPSIQKIAEETESDLRKRCS